MHHIVMLSVYDISGSSANILASIRFFLGDQLGSYYLLMGAGGCDLFPVYGIFPLWFY